MQFSIRDLLWLMVWVSVGSLAIAAVLPRLSEAQKPRFLVSVGVALLFVALAVAVSLVRRARLERLAGAPQLVVRYRAGRWSWLWLVWLGVGAILPLLGTMVAITLEGYSMFLRGWVFYWVAYLSIEKAIAAWWGRNYSLEFCEHGLIYEGKQFVPTERIVDCRWGATLPNRLFIHVPAGQRWEIDVDPPRHAEISQALRERIPVFRRWWEADQAGVNDQHSVSEALEAATWKAITTPADASEKRR